MEKEENKKVASKNASKQEKKVETESQNKTNQAKKVETKNQTKTNQTKKVETKNQTRTNQEKKAEPKKQTKTNKAKKVEPKKQTKTNQAKKVETKNQTKTNQTKKIENKTKQEQAKKVETTTAKKQTKKTKGKQEQKENKNEKHLVKKKGKKAHKFIEIIKKKWLIDGTRTLILIAAIILVVVAINVVIQNLQLAPIDLSQEQLYTLSDEAKEKVQKQNIDKDLNIYFIGSQSGDPNVDLVKQFTKINDHIKVETVEKNKRPDLVEKYQIDDTSQGIIIEYGEKSKVLTAQDLVTFDTTTGQTISIADEKFANSIVTVTTPEVPKVYFLEGYSEFSLQKGMTTLSMLLANEIMEVESLNVVAKGSIPEDCDTLVITTPNKDFDDVATKAITEYINKGGNILWFNSAKTENSKTTLTNVNKILDQYGVKPFEMGLIMETDVSKMVSGQPNLIVPEIESTTITKNIYNTSGVILINPTKISIAEDNELRNKKVESTTLLQTTKGSFFRKDITNTSLRKGADEETNSFIVGAELVKTIEEENQDEGKPAVKSELVIYGENYFISDAQLSSNTQSAAIQYAYNKNIIIDTLSYLADREEDIVARKATGIVTYTATQEQNNIIMMIIIGVPIAIIVLGIIVWIIRRRKK